MVVVIVVFLVIVVGHQSNPQPNSVLFLASAPVLKRYPLEGVNLSHDSAQRGFYIFFRRDSMTKLNIAKSSDETAYEFSNTA